jgi:hypothetical protein
MATIFLGKSPHTLHVSHDYQDMTRCGAVYASHEWCPAGVAVSADGIEWQRGDGQVAGDRSDDDAGACMENNNENWWTLDTHSVAVSDVQLLSSDNVGGGGGVYWMFYTGCDYQPLHVPEGWPGLPAGSQLEGLCARPGLAMSQVSLLA